MKLKTSFFEPTVLKKDQIVEERRGQKERVLLPVLTAIGTGLELQIQGAAPFLSPGCVQ